MAAKSKKRLSKIENKLLKLDKLELKDVICSICQSILIEPVTLPCFHDFCQRCFNGSIENNALSCPLCRLRIGSWLRTATKQKNLINTKLWNYIKSKFSREIDVKTNGEDINLCQDVLRPRLSAPGEIRSEYEAELRRTREERLKLEQKQLEETEIFAKKIQEEEEEAHKIYLEGLKRDELLALQMQNEHQASSSAPRRTNRRNNFGSTNIKPRLKATKIDSFLSKTQVEVTEESPLITDDNTTSTDSSTPKTVTVKTNHHVSPEMVPSYGKLIKSIIDKKVKNGPGLWNKENGDRCKEKAGKDNNKDTVALNKEDKNNTGKQVIQSLLVSLPLSCTGILQHKSNLSEKKNNETDSVDSMRQELCYFKPIEATTPTSFGTIKSLPVRVPGKRVEREPSILRNDVLPSRAQYLKGLCQLRNLSLAKNMPSAFVIALSILRVKKDESAKCTRSRTKKTTSPSTGSVRKNASNKNRPTQEVDGVTKLKNKVSLRRTRSMGSISKEENETTPKKAKHDRKTCSERKPHLRSDSKRSNTKKELNSPPLVAEALNNNKVNLAVKNLSSPLKNCDVKKILQEQLRIEKLIEQEKSDYEFARKMEAEWNGRRQPRRAAIKRQVSLNYALRPAKKLKV